MTTEPDQTTDETTEEQQSPPAGEDQTGEDQTTEAADEDPETFPREYVAQLRQEAAEARVRAKRADEYGQRLHVALVAATGRLADPTDLAFDEAHLDDEDELTSALDELLARKPHLATRRPVGDVGQGEGGASGSVDLADILRSRA